MSITRTELLRWIALLLIMGTAVSCAQVLDPNLPDYGWSEIEAHNTSSDAWIAVDGVVYDISGFVRNHSGGNVFLLGQDNSSVYHRGHGSNTSRLVPYAVGYVATP